MGSDEVQSPPAEWQAAAVELLEGTEYRARIMRSEAFDFSCTGDAASVTPGLKIEHYHILVFLPNNVTVTGQEKTLELAVEDAKRRLRAALKGQE